MVVEVGTLCMLPVVNPVAALGGAVGRVYKRGEADTLVKAGRIEFHLRSGCLQFVGAIWGQS